MNLIIDARWVRTDFHDGISRYTAGLVQGCLENDYPITVLVHDARQLKMLPNGVAYQLVNNPISAKELLLPLKLNRLRADVVFSPLQVMGFWGRKYALFLTLQDIIYYRYPKPPTNLPWYVRAVWRAFHMAKWPQRLLLNRADHVVTVSETSKRFIQEFHLTDRDISVVYNAPTGQTGVSADVVSTTGSKDLVYMGSFMPYKNVETLIAGMQYLPHDYTLHLLSKISAERKAELLQGAPKTASIVFHNGVSDEEYIQLLKNGHSLVTATKEEGFGLPITEAQKLGVPVVCSELDVLHEVAGEGALYFAPDDAKVFAEQVRQLENTAVRAAVIEKGTQQAETFSWQRSAEALWQLAKTTISTK